MSMSQTDGRTDGLFMRFAIPGFALCASRGKNVCLLLLQKNFISQTVVSYTGTVFHSSSLKRHLLTVLSQQDLTDVGETCSSKATKLHSPSSFKFKFKLLPLSG